MAHHTISQHLLCCLAGLALLIAPQPADARVNSVTLGLSSALDYQERDYTEAGEDEGADAPQAASPAGEDDYRRLVLTPLLHFRSSAERDSFEIRLAPGIKYDLIDSETDLDGTVFIAAERALSQYWQVKLANNYLMTDYYRTDDPATPTADQAQTAPPPRPDGGELSPDIGRQRYWQNTATAETTYTYRQGSLVGLAFDYEVLRNEDEDNSNDSSLEDYDRIIVSLRNEHRYSPAWRSSADLSLVSGDFQENQPVGDSPEAGQPSDDLHEYRGFLSLINESIDRHQLSADYSYTATRYDDSDQDDIDIHELQLIWRHDLSPQLATVLGAGPAYEKTEGQDATWAGNGQAEISYRTERGSYGARLEKGFDVENFTGTDERGLVDYWDAALTMTRQLTETLQLTADLSYRWEDREEQIAGLAAPATELQQTVDGAVSRETYHNDRYQAGLGLSYTFRRYYQAAIEYSYTRQESDRLEDDYDDHRILLSLSWEQELFRW
jgi:hypothetical protein